MEGKQRENILGYQESRGRQGHNQMEQQGTQNNKEIGCGEAWEAHEVDQGIDIDQSTS